MQIPDELRNLYPNLSDEQLIEAKENLDRYVLLAWEIMQDQSLPEDSVDDSIDDNRVTLYALDKGRFSKT